jgi:hypothetical protein
MPAGEECNRCSKASDYSYDLICYVCYDLSATHIMLHTIAITDFRLRFTPHTPKLHKITFFLKFPKQVEILNEKR